MQWLFLNLILLLVVSCQIEPDLLSDEDASQGVSLEFVAEYDFHKTDVLVLQDNSTTWGDGNWLMTRQLYMGNNEFAPALREFATRLYFSGMDYQVALMDTTFASEADVTNNAGKLVSFSDELGSVLNGRMSDFVTTLKEKGDLDNSSGRTRRNDKRFMRPLTTLKTFLESGSEEANQFLRSDSFLNIIYVGFRDEMNEVVTADEMAAALDKSRGAGRWRVSVVAPPAEGCVLQRTNDENHRHTLSIAHGSSEEAEYMEYEPKNLLLDLQERSDGMYQSICSDVGFTEFFKRVPKEGSENAFFEVPLEIAANPVTLKILVNDSEVEGWKYDEPRRILFVPTSIPKDQKFTIKYRSIPKSKIGSGVFEHQPFLDRAKDIAGRELSPEELEFVNTIEPILRSNGCIGCHGGANPRLQTFGQVRDASVAILGVIDLDPSDPNFMPRGRTGFDSEANKQTLKDWLNSL